MREIPDIFQKRYLAHQERKKKLLNGETQDISFGEYGQEDYESLMRIMRYRRSRRMFKGKVSDDEMRVLEKAVMYSPSSCNRKAIEVIESKKGVETLVGGKCWVDKADRIMLFYANIQAYKSPNEVDFMPYLDTGFVAQNIYLVCEVLNIKCCFINPNHSGTEIEREGYRFCGAMAIGR